MMDGNRKKRNVAAGVLCGFLLVCAVLLWSDLHRMIPAGGERELTIGVFSDSYWEVQNGYSYYILNDAIELFEEQNPGVKVTYVSGILKEDYSEWLSEQLLIGEAPDVFFVLPEDFNDLAELGALKALSPFEESAGEFSRDGFYSSAYGYGQYDREQYALPYECAPKLMFVNKSILDREEIGMPAEDWSWDDFYEICERVTKDTDLNGVPDQFGVVNYTWRDAFDSNGVELFGPDGEECFLSGASVREAVSFVDKLESLNSGYSVATREFDVGNVAFQPMSFSEYRAYKPYPLSVKKYSGFEWECIPMPKGPSGDNISSLDTLLLAMNRDTKNAGYAWEFMKILTCNEEIQSEIFAYSEGVSVLKEVTNSERTLAKLREHVDDVDILNHVVLSDAVEYAAAAPRFRDYDDAVAEVDRAVRDIIDGNSNISTELTIWNRTINKKLKNHGW